MSARTHPRVVGAFVLGAVALTLAGLVTLGSGRWLQERHRFGVYFPGSVKGLNPGAAVTFRGVKIGEVVGVTAFLTGRPEPLVQIEVVFEIRGDIVDVPEGTSNPFTSLSTPDLARALIQRGVRARLQSQSMLTGQKYIDFDFAPDQPARLSGLQGRRQPELPTTPTAIERVGERFDELTEKLADLPLDQMLEDVRRGIVAARELMESADVKQALAGASRITRAVEPLLEEMRGSFGQARELMVELDGQLEQRGSEASRTMTRTRQALDDLGRSLDTFERTVRSADLARVDATATLQELESTLRALRGLLDYVQAHPEAVLQGKKKGDNR